MHLRSQVAGSWNGRLYAVRQVLGGQQRLALAHAEETRTLNATRQIEQLQLQIKVGTGSQGGKLEQPLVSSVLTCRQNQMYCH